MKIEGKPAKYVTPVKIPTAQLSTTILRGSSDLAANHIADLYANAYQVTPRDETSRGASCDRASATKPDADPNSQVTCTYHQTLKKKIKHFTKIYVHINNLNTAKLELKSKQEVPYNFGG